MALSGAMEKVFGSYFKLRVEWNASQNIANNTSTVTANVYLMSTSSGAYISSSATKNANVSIDGKLYAFSAAGMANLTGGQKKLIKTHSQVVDHNADGTKSTTISSVVGMNVTLSGSYVGDVSVSQTVTLDTIPRASTITSSGSWTAGENPTVNINRVSSSFTHTVLFYVNNVEIKRITGVATSTSSSFSTAENEKIFVQLARTDSKASRIDVQTYSGSTLIGTASVSGTCYNSAATTISMPNFTVGDNPTITISRAKSYFNTKLTFTLGSFTKSKTDSSSSTTLDFTSTDNNSMLSQMSTSSSKTGSMKVETLYNNTLVRDAKTYEINVSVPSYEITFGGSFTYKDTNSTSVAITGNNQYIIQNLSQVSVTLPSASKATSSNGATITKYEFLLNGVTKSVNYTASDIITSFGQVNASSNLTLTVTAFDSRGKTKSQQVTVQMLSYSAPILSASIKRKNNYEEEAYLNCSVSYYPLDIEGVMKNPIRAMEYRYKEKTSTSWTAWKTWAMMILPIAEVVDSFSMPEQTFTGLDSLKDYNFEVRISDTLGSTTTTSLLLSAGQPLLYMDALNKKVSIKQITTDSNAALEVNGSVLPIANYDGTTSYQDTPTGLSVIYSDEANKGLPATHSTALTIGANINRQFQIAAKNDGSGLWYRTGHVNNTGGTGVGWTDWKSITGGGASSITDPLEITGNSKSVRVGTGSTDVFLNNTKSNKYLQLKDDGTIAYDNKEIWHKGNAAEIFVPKMLNSHNGITVNGNDAGWVRTPKNGILPYQAGENTGLGTRDWRFLDCFVKNGSINYLYDVQTINNFKITGVSGGWWNSIGTVQDNGVMEIGKYIDFHDTSGTTADYNARITQSASDLVSSRNWVSTCDKTKKENIEYIEPSVLNFKDYIKNEFKPAKYNYKNSKDINLGIIAQDFLGTIAEEIVRPYTELDKQSGLEKEVYGVDNLAYTTLIGIALRDSIVEKDREISALKQQIETLNENIAAIENVLILAGLAQ